MGAPDLLGAIAGWLDNRYKQATGFVEPSEHLIAVPGLGSIMGAILTGFFAVQADGSTASALDGNVAQILIQPQGMVATISWSGTASAFILFVIDKVIGFRVDAEAEGLDINQHGEMLH